jgi:D-glycero-D-manno-heptose 1,7-bisphosphate phosphatase
MKPLAAPGTARAAAPWRLAGLLLGMRGLATSAAAAVMEPSDSLPTHDAPDEPTRPRGRRPAVFIDKDGTLVEDVPYNVDPELLRLTPGAAVGLRRLAEAGFALVLVTNQPGLAHGRFSRAAFQTLENALRALLRDEAGIELDAVMVCPHAPAPPDRACLCRKPAPGLLRQAAVAHGLDLAASWMVGDILDDIEAGRRAGCRTVLLDVGNETEWRRSPLRTPDHTVKDLDTAAHLIVREAALHAGLGAAGPGA